MHGHQNTERVAVGCKKDPGRGRLELIGLQFLRLYTWLIKIFHPLLGTM